jgi:uridylate kinase
LRATKVDGIYTADPVSHPNAERFLSITYDEILEKQLGVMDLTAICLARDHGMPLRVFQLDKQDALLNAVVGDDEGTLVIAQPSK